MVSVGVCVPFLFYVVGLNSLNSVSRLTSSCEAANQCLWSNHTQKSDLFMIRLSSFHLQMNGVC